MTAEDLFHPVLGSDERLLWTGQPTPGPGPSSWSRIEILVVLGAVGALLRCALHLDQSLSPIEYWGPAGILIVAIIAHIYYRGSLDAWRLARVFYAVSNRRVFIATGASKKKIRFLPLEWVRSVQLRPSDRNVPTMVLDAGSHSWLLANGSELPNAGFEQFMAYLPDADKVRDIIERAKQEKAAS